MLFHFPYSHLWTMLLPQKSHIHSQHLDTIISRLQSNEHLGINIGNTINELLEIHKIYITSCAPGYENVQERYDKFMHLVEGRIKDETESQLERKPVFLAIIQDAPAQGY